MYLIFVLQISYNFYIIFMPVVIVKQNFPFVNLARQDGLGIKYYASADGRHLLTAVSFIAIIHLVNT